MEANSFDILLAILKAYKREGEKYVEAPAEYSWAKLDGPSNLLNNVLRHVYCNKHRRCVSEGARELWIKLGMEADSIFEYYGGARVYYKNTEPVEIKKYNGAHAEPYWTGEVYIEDGSGSFKFNDVFHEEHIVPVKMIRDELLKLDLDRSTEEIYADFNRLLNNLSICRMLKEEDRTLNKIAKVKRPCDYQAVIDGIYTQAGIVIADWKDWVYKPE